MVITSGVPIFRIFYGIHLKTDENRNSYLLEYRQQTLL